MSYNVLHAIRDLVTGKLEFATKDVVAKRNAECSGCEAKSRGVCTVCGCIVFTKTRLKESSCPMELW